MKKIMKAYLCIWGFCILVATLLFGASILQDANDEALSNIALLKSINLNYIPRAPHRMCDPDLDKIKTTELLVDSIVQIESGGNAKLVGKHGERGLMQIKHGTWNDMTKLVYGKKMSFEKAFNPTMNRIIGAAYLSYLYEFIQDHRDEWKADERSLLIACYNAGPNCVKKAGFSLKRLSAETQDYVTRTSALHDCFLSENNQLKLAQLPTVNNSDS